jgi:hypothetical protein
MKQDIISMRGKEIHTGSEWKNLKRTDLSGALIINWRIIVK